MNEINAIAWAALAAPVLEAVFSLVAAAALVGLIKSNKGARINGAWGLIAFGLACFGLVGVDRTLELFGLPNASAVRDALSALGALIIAVGALKARGAYRKLLK